MSDDMSTVQTDGRVFEVPAPVAALVERLRLELEQGPTTTGMHVPGFGYFGNPQVLADLLTRAQDEALTRAQRVDELSRELAQVRLNARNDVLNAEARHERFRQQVRELAIEKADELNWCDEGLNAALRELGLDPKTRTYDVTFRIQTEVTVQVDASDEDDAKRVAQDTWDAADLCQRANAYDFEVDEVTGVEESDD